MHLQMHRLCQTWSQSLDNKVAVCVDAPGLPSLKFNVLEVLQCLVQMYILKKPCASGQLLAADHQTKLVDTGCG